MGRTDADFDLEGFLEALRGAADSPVPQGGLRRTLRTARAAVGTSLSVVSGRFRGRGGGMGAADLRAIRKLVTNLGELKGLAMKMGQIMSYIDVTLPPEMRDLMSLLQTQSQPTAFARVEETIRADLGDRAAALLEHLDRAPVSVASIGQVHRARLPDGTAVAVKVLHPGIREALEADFAFARIGPVFAKLMAPGAGVTVKEFMAEMRDRMLEECDYSLEARRQQRFGGLLAAVPGVVIPAVHPDWCAPRVLVTTWEPGLDLEAFLGTEPPQAIRDRAGASLFEVYFGTLYRHGLFHADPHPGNYAFRGDGTVVVYDFGCAREFDDGTIRALALLGHAVVADREAEIRAAFEALGGAVPPGDKAYAHVHRLLRGFFMPLLTPGPHVVDGAVNMAMGEVARDKRMLMRMRMPGKLLFLFRIRFGLYAVLARLGARCDWSSLERTLSEGATATRLRPPSLAS